jgi:hypothetical protein
VTKKKVDHWFPGSNQVVGQEGCHGQKRKKEMMKRSKETFESAAVHVPYLNCGDKLMGHIEHVEIGHLYKPIKLHILNMYSSLYINQNSLWLSKNKCNMVVFIKDSISG